MRALVLLLCICCFSVRAHADDWTAVPLGTTSDLYAISNTPLSNHWVVGANGFAARSNADRTGWTIQNPQTNADLYSVDEPSGSEVWMGGGTGVVRMWLYAGWFNRDLPSQDSFRLFTRQGAKCMAVGAGGEMIRWAGGFWSAIESGVTVDLNAGAGMPSGLSWVVGNGGTIIKSTDGNVWNQIASGTTADLYGIAELDLTNLYAVGEVGTILRSTDAGASWSPRQSGTTRTLRAISISKSGSHTHLIAVGLQGTVLKSTDSGDSWCPLNVTTADLYAAEAFTNTELYVAGAGGLLLRTTNGGGSCGAATGVEIHVPTTLSILGPFPQPSTDVAMFRISADSGGSFQMAIFDVTGRRILDLPEWRATSAGETVITLDTRDLVAGVYFLRVRGDGLEASRRLVIAR